MAPGLKMLRSIPAAHVRLKDHQPHSTKISVLLWLPINAMQTAIVKMSRLMTKRTKWHVRPVKTQISLGNMSSLIRVFAVSMKKAWFLSYPFSAQRRLRSDWADAILLVLSWGGSNAVSSVVVIFRFGLSWKLDWQNHPQKSEKRLSKKVSLFPVQPQPQVPVAWGGVFLNNKCLWYKPQNL